MGSEQSARRQKLITFIWDHNNNAWREKQTGIRVDGAWLAAPQTDKFTDEAFLQPAWTKELDSREWSQVLHAIVYARDHIGAGAPGHGQFVLIAKLAKMLDDREPHENG